MYEKYGLTHWKNSGFKSFLITVYTAFKNDLYEVFDGNKTVGTFQTRREGDALHFGKLATDPSVSGKGIGGYVIAEMERMAEAGGLRFLRCEVYDRSEHAYSFYKRRGFSECGEVETRKYKEKVLEKRVGSVQKKKVLIIGAGFLQAFVIKRAKELGYEVHALDGNPEATGFRFADKYAAVNIVDSEACLAYAMENKVDGVLTAATDYGVLTAATIAEKMGLNGLNLDSARLIKNKYLIRKRLFENRVDDTEQAYLVEDGTDIDALSERVKYPVMVKPCDGSGSRGASRVDRAEDFAEACRYAMDGSITKRAEVESFIFGNEYGVESFVENGNIHILAVMKKWMTEPPYYAELGHAVPSGLPEAVEEKVKNCVRGALVALGVNFGSVNMDLLITDEGGVHIIDIGARMGGNLIGSHIVPISSGIDYMGNMIKAAVGDKVDFTPGEKKSVATRLLAFEGGVVTDLSYISEAERKFGVEVHHHLAQGQTVNKYKTNLDGGGYVVAKANEIDTAIANAAGAFELIKKTLS